MSSDPTDTDTAPDSPPDPYANVAALPGCEEALRDLVRPHWRVEEAATADVTLHNLIGKVRCFVSACVLKDGQLALISSSSDMASNLILLDTARKHAQGALFARMAAQYRLNDSD